MGTKRGQTFFDVNDILGSEGEASDRLQVGFAEDGDGDAEEFDERFEPLVENEIAPEAKSEADSVGVRFMAAMQQQMQNTAQLVQGMQQMLQQIPTMVQQTVAHSLGNTKQAPAGDDTDKYFAHLNGNEEDVNAAKAALKPLVQGMMSDMMGEIQRLRQELSTRDASHMRQSVEQQLHAAVDEVKQRTGVRLFNKGDLTEYMAARPGVSFSQAARELERERLKEYNDAGFRRQTRERRGTPTPFPKVPGGGGITTNRALRDLNDVDDYIDQATEALIGRMTGRR